MKFDYKLIIAIIVTAVVFTAVADVIIDKEKYIEEHINYKK